jgi:hypothetical protein
MLSSDLSASMCNLTIRFSLFFSVGEKKGLVHWQQQKPNLARELVYYALYNPWSWTLLRSSNLRVWALWPLSLSLSLVMATFALCMALGVCVCGLGCRTSSLVLHLSFLSILLLRPRHHWKWFRVLQMLAHISFFDFNFGVFCFVFVFCFCF